MEGLGDRITRADSPILFLEQTGGAIVRPNDRFFLGGGGTAVLFGPPIRTEASKSTICGIFFSDEEEEEAENRHISREEKIIPSWRKRRFFYISYSFFWGVGRGVIVV